jgi:hypothetical protein
MFFGWSKKKRKILFLSSLFWFGLKLRFLCFFFLPFCCGTVKLCVHRDTALLGFVQELRERHGKHRTTVSVNIGKAVEQQSGGTKRVEHVTAVDCKVGVLPRGQMYPFSHFGLHTAVL